MHLSIKFLILGVFCLVASSQLFTTTAALVLKDVASISFEEQKKVIIINRLEGNQHTDMKSMDDPIKLLFEALFSKFNEKTQYQDDSKRHLAKLTESEPTLEKELPILPPDTSDAPDVCKDGSIDTATRTENGNTYLFKGKFYWKILNNGIADGYPRRITDDWGGLEGNLDASLTWSNGRTYFFKGKQYWRFKNEKMDPGYPKLISQGFRGIPDNLDAVVVWSGNGATYFFKEDKYWRYNSTSDTPVDEDYPCPIKAWNGLPNDSIDAAIQLENKQTYFFKGGKCYKYNDEKDEVDIPQQTPVLWFGCKPTTEGISVNHGSTINVMNHVITSENHVTTTEGISVNRETTGTISVNHETNEEVPVNHETTKEVPVNHETNEEVPVNHETTDDEIPVSELEAILQPRLYMLHNTNPF